MFQVHEEWHVDQHQEILNKQLFSDELIDHDHESKKRKLSPFEQDNVPKKKKKKKKKGDSKDIASPSLSSNIDIEARDLTGAPSSDKSCAATVVERINDDLSPSKKKSKQKKKIEKSLSVDATSETFDNSDTIVENDTSTLNTKKAKKKKKDKENLFRDVVDGQLVKSKQPKSKRKGDGEGSSSSVSSFTALAAALPQHKTESDSRDCTEVDSAKNVFTESSVEKKELGKCNEHKAIVSSKKAKKEQRRLKKLTDTGGVELKSFKSLAEESCTPNDFDTKDVSASSDSNSDSQINISNAVKEVTQSNRAPISDPKYSKFQNKLNRKIEGGQFRWLNEQLYTKPSSDSVQLFKDSPDLFPVYHKGFQAQVKTWPLNPVDVIIRDLNER